MTATLPRPAKTLMPPADRPPVRGYRLADLPRLAALPVALVLWLISLPQINPDGMGDLGLLPMLPVTFWLALAVLLLGYCAVLRRPGASSRLLVAHLLTLIAILHATPSLTYGSLRYSWAWKHVGIVDYFMRHAGVNPSIVELNAYQFWPGFFTLNAMLAKAAGLDTSLGYAAWGPPFFNALLIGPLFLIFRTFTTDRRLVWTALGIYFLGSWVGQDYFSPQACAYFLYLTFIAFCLRYLKPKIRPTGGATPPVTVAMAAAALMGSHAELSTRRRRLLVALALVPIMLAIVPTHQLTPLMLVSALVLLTIVCRQRVALLALGMIALTVGWDLTFAGPFIMANLQGIAASFGTLGANATSGFINLSGATQGQVIVAQIDRIFSAAVALLALVGFARRFRSRRELALPVLAIAPIPLMLTSDYGGEMIFRVYLFGLPFAAFYAAACFFPTQRAGRSRWTALALPAVLLLLVPGFAVSYYGKEEANYFSPPEVSAARYLYGIAPRGSLIIGATSDFPWAFTDYEFYDYYRFALEDIESRQAVINDPVGTVADLMDPELHHHAYLILSSSQVAQVETTGIMPVGSVARIAQTLTDSPRFTVVYRDPSAVVITLAQPVSEAAP